MIGQDFHGGGHPWHGRCVGGVLTLPNSTTRTYPQPSGADAFTLTVPGFVAPTRSLNQLDADTAAGYQWLPYSILSGDAATAPGLQVYGKHLGVMRWIWAASVNQKWRVDAAGLSVDAGVLSGNLLFHEFGNHHPDGTPPLTASVPVSIAVETTPAAYITILSINSTGSAVLLGISTLGRHADAADEYDMNPLPQTVVLLQLSAPSEPEVVATIRHEESYTRLENNPVGTTLKHMIESLFYSDAVHHTFVFNDLVSSALTENQYRFQAENTLTGNIFDLRLRSTVSRVLTNPTTVEYDLVRPTPGVVQLTGSHICSGGFEITAYDFAHTIPDLAAEAAADLIAGQATIAAEFEYFAEPCPHWEWITNPGAGWFTTEPVLNQVTVFNESATIDDLPSKSESVNTVATAMQAPFGSQCTGPVEVSWVVGASTIWYSRRKTTTASTGSRVEIYPAAVDPGCGEEQYYLYAPSLTITTGHLIPNYTDTASLYATVNSAETLISVIETPALDAETSLEKPVLDWDSDRYIFRSHDVDMAHIIYRRTASSVVINGFRIINGLQTDLAQFVAQVMVDGIISPINQWTEATPSEDPEIPDEPNHMENWQASRDPITGVAQVDTDAPLVASCWV